MGVIFILITDDDKPQQTAAESSDPFEKLWTAQQAADYLNTDDNTVYELARKGKLPSVPLSEKRVRFIPAVIREWALNGGKIETKLRAVK